MNQEHACEIARDALIWLANRPDLLEGFLVSSGADLGDLRSRAADPEFLGFVLDHLLASDPAVLAFAADAGLNPEIPARARAALPGGTVPNWT